MSPVRSFECRLLEIFNEVHLAYKQFDSRLKAEGFKVRVMRIFRAWEDWAVYPREFLVRLQNAFLGLVTVSVDTRKNYQKFIFSFCFFFFNEKFPLREKKTMNDRVFFFFFFCNNYDYFETCSRPRSPNRKTTRT